MESIKKRPYRGPRIWRHELVSPDWVRWEVFFEFDIRVEMLSCIDQVVSRLTIGIDQGIDRYADASRSLTFTRDIYLLDFPCY